MVKQLKHRMDLIFDTAETREDYFAFIALFSVAFWVEPIYFLVSSVMLVVALILLVYLIFKSKGTENALHCI